MLDSKFLKILVTGAFNSGKTTFIQQISEQPVVSVERVSEKHGFIAMDWGRLTIDPKMFVYFFGAPGGSNNFYDEPIFIDFPNWSAIIMVNAMTQSTMSRSSTKEVKAHLLQLRTMNMPYLIAINRYDAEGALTEHEVRDAIEATPSEIIVKCNANSRVEVRDALLMLIKQMPEDNVIKKVRTRLMQL